MKGLDVSEFQSGLDLSKTSGYDFVIIRAGYGNVITQKDKSFEYHVQNAIKANMTIGAYWFSYAIDPDDAQKEADVCAAVLEKYKSRISLPVFFDWEYDSESYCKRNGVTPTKELVTKMTISFINRMRSHGYEGGYYTNLDYMSRMYDYEEIKKYPLWLAQYEGQAKYPFTVRQTSSKGKVSGYSGTVDLDEMDVKKPAPTFREIRVTYGDIVPSIAKEYGVTEDAILNLNGRKKTEFLTSLRIPTKTVEEVAKEIIRGEGGWGYWPFRSSRLKKAGYDPDAVQDKINELLGAK